MHLEWLRVCAHSSCKSTQMKVAVKVQNNSSTGWFGTLSYHEIQLCSIVLPDGQEKLRLSTLLRKSVRDQWRTKKGYLRYSRLTEIRFLINQIRVQFWRGTRDSAYDVGVIEPAGWV